MRLYFYLILILLGSNLSSSLAQSIHDSLLIASLERTTCYGKCPYYKISVYRNGVVLMNGKKNVVHIGQYKAVVSPRKITQLLEKAYQIDYLSLANKYPLKGLGIIDFPTCITYLKINKKEKTIYNRNDSPAKLVEYEQFFDRLFEDLEWKALMKLPSEK